MWQYLLTIAIVTIAALVVLRTVWRAISGTGKVGCGSGCNKCAAPKDDVPEGRIRLPQV